MVFRVTLFVISGGIVKKGRKYEIERNFFDRGIFSLFFDLNYFFITLFGLNVYSMIVFFLGACTFFGTLVALLSTDSFID